MSTVVISTILIALMTSVGLTSFYARYDALGRESNHAARALAEGCINVALLALATSTDSMHYIVNNQQVVVGVDTHGMQLNCTIKDIIHSGTTATIDAYAASNNSFSTVSVVVSLVPGIQIISWQ
jgi:hypothetical protein